MKYLKHINESLSQQELDKFKSEVESTVFSLCEYLDDIDVKYYEDSIIYKIKLSEEYDSFSTMTDEEIMRILNNGSTYGGSASARYGIRIHFTVDKKKKDINRIGLSGDEMETFSKIVSHANLIRKKLDNYYVKLNISSPASWSATSFELLIINQ